MLQKALNVPARLMPAVSDTTVYGTDAENPLTLRAYQVEGLTWLLFNW